MHFLHSSIVKTAIVHMQHFTILGYNAGGANALCPEKIQGSGALSSSLGCL